MDFVYKLTPKKITVKYTGKKIPARLDSGAFTDLMVCFGNMLRREKERFGDEILTSKKINAILWRESNEQYKYYSGEDSF